MKNDARLSPLPVRRNKAPAYRQSSRPGNGSLRRSDRQCDITDAPQEQSLVRIICLFPLCDHLAVSSPVSSAGEEGIPLNQAMSFKETREASTRRQSRERIGSYWRADCISHSEHPHSTEARLLQFLISSILFRASHPEASLSFNEALHWSKP